MGSRYHILLDPDCPVASAYLEALFGDPLTPYSGVGDEIAGAFEITHRAECVRCAEYGAANIAVVF